MINKITQVLESIGMNKSEIKIYIDLVQNKKSSALDISKRTKIHRSNTYDVLRGLTEKGFVKEFIEEKRKLFFAMEPEKIKDYLKQREKEIDSIISQLNDFSQQSNVEESVSITKGQFAAREAITDLLKKEKPIDVYGASNESIQTLGEGFLEDYHKTRVRKKIMMRHIYNPSSLDRINFLNKIKFTEARCLSSKYDTHVSTIICDDTVILTVFIDPVSVITIKNREVAETYRKYFEILWSKSSQEKCETNQ